MKKILIFCAVIGSILVISSTVYSGDTARTVASSNYIKPGDSVLRERLSPLQYSVTQDEDTEQPFKNEYWDEKRDGIYVDVVSGEPLFSSTHKFKSGTGWPSFYQALETTNIAEKTDYYLIYPRTEVRSKMADSHLGHLFNDGPKPTGLRYCVNSAALKFIPEADLKKEGYEKYARLFKISNKQDITDISSSK